MKLISALMFGVVLAASGQALAQAPTAPAAAAVDPAAFLAANAKAPGVTVTASGLQYRVVQSGPAGPSPTAGDVVKVDYEGSLLSGEVFDSTYKRGHHAIMQLADLVPAWMEALPMMHVGDEWIIYVPAKLGYGEAGAGPIPPNSVLVFRLKLLGMLTND